MYLKGKLTKISHTLIEITLYLQAEFSVYHLNIYSVFCKNNNETHDLCETLYALNVGNFPPSSLKMEELALA